MLEDEDLVPLIEATAVNPLTSRYSNQLITFGGFLWEGLDIKMVSLKCSRIMIPLESLIHGVRLGPSKIILGLPVKDLGIYCLYLIHDTRKSDDNLGIRDETKNIGDRIRELVSDWEPR